MNWNGVRQQYPETWLLIEAIRAHSFQGKRNIEEFSVLSTFPNSIVAFREYIKQHRELPEREFYVLHTSKESFEIIERPWRGFQKL